MQQYSVHLLNYPAAGSQRGSYMSAHILLNLLNVLEKRDKMRG